MILKSNGLGEQGAMEKNDMQQSRQSQMDIHPILGYTKEIVHKRQARQMGDKH